MLSDIADSVRMLRRPRSTFGDKSRLLPSVSLLSGREKGLWAAVPVLGAACGKSCLSISYDWRFGRQGGALPFGSCLQNSAFARFVPGGRGNWWRRGYGVCVGNGATRE